MVPQCCKAVITGRPEPRDAGELGQAAVGTATGKNGNNVDGLRDQGAGDRDDGFLDQLLESTQRSERGARVDGTDTAGMTRAPGLEQI